jgi:Na+/H+ antiporter NhaD/arsenite permease-like protein/S1-C subfamily serine protease
MRLQSTKSWIVVLSAFLLVVLGCIGWQKLTSVKIGPTDIQQVCNPQTALAPVSPCVVSLWAVSQKGLETHINVIGCGLVVDSRGLILTSATLPPDIQSLHVIDHKDNKYEANRIAYDKKSKLTLLKVDTANAAEGMVFEAVGLTDSVQVKTGDSVLALGSRRTPSSWELTTKTGQVTDPRQSLVVKKIRYRDLVQTDVELTSENAGGPLVNSRGIVVGFALPFVQPENSASSFSYAVAVDKAENFLSRLPIPHWTEGAAEPVCSWLGAEMLGANPVLAAGLSAPENHGQVVNHIQNNSPAEHAGLKRGDIIMDIDGNKITDASSFDKTALGLCQTKKTRIRILREGDFKTLTLNWTRPMYTSAGTGSLEEVVLVILIFTLMYYFVYKNVFDRVILFVLGAIVAAITGHHLGFYEQGQIASVLFDKLDVLLFIAGMQLITGVLDEAGALEYLAKKITLATGGNAWRVMWLFCIVTYGFSLFVNNLTTIMLMVPMVLNLSKYLDCDPKPFLISMIIASNLGGASTMIGDFPNMLIGTETGLPFYQFTSYMLPICLFELFVLLGFLRVFRPSLFKTGAGALLQPAVDSASAFEPVDEDYPELNDTPNDSKGANLLFNTIQNSLPRTIKSKEKLMRGLIILAAVIGGFLIADVMDWSPALVALAGGIMAMAFGRCDPFRLLAKVSIKDILFFSGLFVLVGAAEASGALGYISGAIVGLSYGNTLVLCMVLMWAGAFVTCFLNAGPTTALFLPIVLSFKSAAPHSLYWWSLSLGVCAGSSGTLAGATAGPLAATMFSKFIKKQQQSETDSDGSERADAVEAGDDCADSVDRDRLNLTELTFKEFASLGLPVMTIFLLISSIYITVLYRW